MKKNSAATLFNLNQRTIISAVLICYIIVATVFTMMILIHAPQVESSPHVPPECRNGWGSYRECP